MALRIKAVLMSEDIPTFVRKFVKARMKSNVVNISRVSSGKRADTYFVDSKNKRYVCSFTAKISDINLLKGGTYTRR